MDTPEKKLTWLRRRTSLEKGLILMIALALFCTAFFACKLLIDKSWDNGSHICTSPDCVKAAADILKKIDHSVHPCENFYDFVCGNFIKENFIPDDSTSVTPMTGVFDQYMLKFKRLLEQPIVATDRRSLKLIKTIYKSCMNDTQIEQESVNYFKNMFKIFGGWPVIDPHNWKEKNFDWIKLLYRFRQIGLRQNMFFSMYVATDDKNSSKKILKISQPCLPYDRLKKGLNDTVMKAYYNYAVDIVTSFGADRDRATIEMKEVLEFEINLANITVPRENLKNSTLLYNPTRIRDLQKNITSIPWLEFINNYLGPNEMLNTYDFVNVASSAFLVKLEDLLFKTNERVLANYMFWTVVKGSISFLPEKIRNKDLEFRKLAYGLSAPYPRWQSCCGTASRLNIAMAALYIQHFATPTSKDKVEELVSDIKESFLETLKSTGWMDKVTKQHALQKALKMGSFIGYPEELLDEDKIDMEYTDLNLNPDAYIFDIRLNLSLFEHRKEVVELRKLTPKSVWRSKSYVYMINAYYDENDNSIEIPAGILQDPYFNENRPQYLNYGAIGYVIGHEITHGFDDRGRQYDKDGNLIDWWQPETNLTFANKAQCLVEQYGNYTIAEIDTSLNGLTNLDENIADNGGIKIAYRGYQRWLERNKPEALLPGLPYTPEQMFWISAASGFCVKYKNEILKQMVVSGSHAPSRYRVIVPFMNSEHFAKDFQCPLGTPMNPEHKCRVW